MNGLARIYNRNTLAVTLGKKAMSAEGNVYVIVLATVGVALTKWRTLCPRLWQSEATDFSI